MANHVTYTRADGTDIKLKLTAERSVELEEKLKCSIPDATKDLDKLGTACEFVAAAIADGSYKQRKETAYEIYDEMTDEGKTIQDYQYLVFDILVSAGFLNGKAVLMQKDLIEKAQEKREKLLAESTTALQS